MHMPCFHRRGHIWTNPIIDFHSHRSLDDGAIPCQIKQFCAGVEYNYGDYFYKESQIQECLHVLYAEYFETYKNTACQMGFTSAYFKVCSYLAGLN